MVGDLTGGEEDGEAVPLVDDARPLLEGALVIPF
jgi:hypothetical protein